jgi:hypothetical protein
VLTSPSSREIFNKQRNDGSWCSGGSWSYKHSYVPKPGCTPVSPKYVTTSWLLSKLGDMGYTVKDPRVAKACEWVMEWQRPNGVLTERREQTESSGMEIPNKPCRMSIQLNGLAKVGFGADPRLRRSWDLILKWRRDDDGWLQDGHLDGSSAPYKVWTRSCPWVSFFAVSSLFHSGVPDLVKEAKMSLTFTLWHMNQKDPDELKRFFWHGHEPVMELLMFSESGYSPDEPSIAALLEWLKSMYNLNQGFFHYMGKPYSKMTLREDGADSRVMKYRMYHVAEDDWLTYWCTRIFSNFLHS